MIIVDWTVTLYSELADIEVETLAVTASENGISDWTISKSGRIITAETAREEEAIYWIVEWLAEAVIDVTVIAQIKEERIYWPEFEDEEPRIEVVFESGSDTKH